jgi:secreted trypsin-like serine protease
MTTSRSRLVWPSIVAMTVAILVPGQAVAVVGSQPDEANVYANVGLLQYLAPGGVWQGGCTGTLVASDVVLTAAHCVYPAVPAGAVRVTFDATPVESSTTFAVDHFVIHPGFISAWPPTPGKNTLASPWEDIALVWLVEPVAGLEPAPIAHQGDVDALDPGSDTVTVVGYGVNAFTEGSAFSPQFQVEIIGTRSFRDVAILNLHDAFPDRFVKISAGNCFGDSGGPLFHGHTVVAITAWVNGPRCDTPGLDYRVDSAIAQEFLTENMGS